MHHLGEQRHVLRRHLALGWQLSQLVRNIGGQYLWRKGHSPSVPVCHTCKMVNLLRANQQPFACLLYHLGKVQNVPTFSLLHPNPHKIFKAVLLLKLGFNGCICCCFTLVKHLCSANFQTDFVFRFEQTQALGIQVDYLINNAGLGGHGKFAERDLADEMHMVQVNIIALMSLTRLYLPSMLAQQSGRILNVSSTASFMPVPNQAVYYATKAFVTSFSQAVAQEVSVSGVTVTALCPGAVATGFVAAGNLQGVAAWDNAKSAQSVAQYGHKAIMRGELVAFNEGKLRFMLDWIIPFLPRHLVLKMSQMAMEKK